ncbi:MAG: hypothetical protein N2322_08320 [Terrimicrobiaceae bacterium]|nr:hypothetical protein [Terrimicrobiaceae bacterium]
MPTRSSSSPIAAHVLAGAAVGALQVCPLGAEDGSRVAQMEEVQVTAAYLEDGFVGGSFWSEAGRFS